MWLKVEHQLECMSYDMGSYVHDMLAIYSGQKCLNATNANNLASYLEGNVMQEVQTFSC